MKRMVLSQDVISAFITQQRQDEKSKATLEKYNRDILAFYSFLPEDKRVDKAMQPCEAKCRPWGGCGQKGNCARRRV